MQARFLDHTTIIRHVLDKAEVGGAVLDVDILDRALARRHVGLRIHKIYLSGNDLVSHHERVGESEIHWHPISYRKDRMDAQRGEILAALSSVFLGLIEAERPSFFVNHVPEHGGGTFLSQLARGAGLPVCSIFHGGNRPTYTVEPEHARSIDLVTSNLRATAGLSDVVAAVSDSASALLPMTRVRNLGTAADAAFFDPARVAPGYLRARFGFPLHLPIFLLAARIVAEKGHKNLLDAAQLLFDRRIDHRIVFAGCATAETKSEIERYIRGNGFDGLATIVYDATQEEMVQIYRDADIVVLPGYHLEGCPRCLIEAGLMEKPVVATDAGGTREAFFPGASGLLVPVGDCVALADALESLARNPARRTLMGQVGRQFAKVRFDPDALAARHEDAYLDLMRPALSVTSESRRAARPAREDRLSVEAAGG